MDYRRFGRTGLKVSCFGLGTMQWGWTADEPTAGAVMDAFVERGGNFLDTADFYSRWLPGHVGGESEEIIGRWMQQRGNRNALIIATKVYQPMGSTPTTGDSLVNILMYPVAHASHDWILHERNKSMNEQERRELSQRLSRIEGQARGSKKMVDVGQDETSILVQLMALQKATRAAATALVKAQALARIREQVRAALSACPGECDHCDE